MLPVTMTFMPSLGLKSTRGMVDLHMQQPMTASRSFSEKYQCPVLASLNPEISPSTVRP